MQDGDENKDTRRQSGNCCPVGTIFLAILSGGVGLLAVGYVLGPEAALTVGVEALLRVGLPVTFGGNPTGNQTRPTNEGGGLELRQPNISAPVTKNLPQNPKQTVSNKIDVEPTQKQSEKWLVWRTKSLFEYRPGGFSLTEAPFGATLTREGCKIVYYLDGKKLEAEEVIRLNVTEHAYKIRVCAEGSDNRICEELLQKIFITKKNVKIDWRPPEEIVVFEKTPKIPDSICTAKANVSGVDLVYEWVEPVQIECGQTLKNCGVLVTPSDVKNFSGQTKCKIIIRREKLELTEKQKKKMVETSEECKFSHSRLGIKRVFASWIGFAQDSQEIVKLYNTEIGGGLAAGQVLNVCCQGGKAGGHYFFLGCKIPMYHYSKGDGTNSATAWTIVIGQTRRVVGIGCHVKGGAAIYKVYFFKAQGQKLFENVNLAQTNLEITDETQEKVLPEDDLLDD